MEHLRAVAPQVRVEVEHADFADLTQVHNLADRLARQSAPDVVVSNAALVAPVHHRTAGGIPLTIAANFLAPYVLLRRLGEAFAHHASGSS